MYTGIKIDDKLRWRSFTIIIQDYLEGGERDPSSLALQLFGMFLNPEYQNNEFKKSDLKQFL